MTRSPALDRLREHDPARLSATDDAPPMHVLHQILDAPVPAAPPSRRPAVSPVRRRGAIAIATLAVAAGAVVAAPAILGGSSPSLAARAYAATAPGQQVLHSVRTITAEYGGKNIPESDRRASWTQESWAFGDDLHTRSDFGGTDRETAVADGTFYSRQPDGTVDSAPAGVNPYASGRGAAVDAILDFRTAYAADELTDTGMVTFAGRQARRYTVPEDRSSRDGGPTDVDARVFFVDAETAEPLGAQQVYSAFAADGSLKFRDTFLTEIKSVERLEPDAAARALVTPSWVGPR